MMLMAIDHIRDYIARSAMQFSPTDLTRTTAAIFLTRWITHFCAPVFMLTAGLGAFFWMSRGHRSKGPLARFLISRGVWLLFLEVTVLRLIVFSQISFRADPVILMVTVQVPTYLGLDNSGRISEAMVDECENWATNCRHRWPC
jgi:uncharacterized membrane protein